MSVNESVLITRELKFNDDSAARGQQRTRQRNLRFQDLAQYFKYPTKEAAEYLGISTSALKIACRRLGVRRWPYRRYRSIQRTIDALTKTISRGGNQDKYKLIQERHNLNTELRSLMMTGNPAFCHICLHQDDSIAPPVQMCADIQENTATTLTTQWKCVADSTALLQQPLDEAIISPSLYEFDPLGSPRIGWSEIPTSVTITPRHHSKVVRPSIFPLCPVAECMIDNSTWRPSISECLEQNELTEFSEIFSSN